MAAAPSQMTARRVLLKFVTDSRPGFGGLGCGPSQLTEGEPGCIFLPQRVTNPVESPLGLPYQKKRVRNLRAISRISLDLAAAPQGIER